MKFSIIIITYNRKKNLVDCLSSINTQDIKVPYEVLVVFNGDLTHISKMKSQFPNIQFHYIPKTSPAVARNFAIPKAQGEHFFFLDDDCQLPPNYFANIDFNEDWDVLGGPDRTPLQSSSFQVNIGRVLSSPLCMGYTAKRHHAFSSEKLPLATERELILCNLWIKKDIFDDVGNLFSADLFRNEENYLLKKLKKENKTLFYDPNLFVYHSRKENLETLSLSVIKSGECRVINFAKLSTRPELYYFLPLIFSILFLFLTFSASIYLAIPFLIYSLVVFIYGIMKIKTYSPMFVFMHYYILFCYSIGLVIGLTNVSLHKFKAVVH